VLFPATPEEPIFALWYGRLYNTFVIGFAMLMSFYQDTKQKEIKWRTQKEKAMS